MRSDLRDRIRGCLVAGAAGDALGYEVEFKSESAIFADYGKDGITEYTLKNGIARISDDTQMTMFTADALISAHADLSKPTERHLLDAYLDWYKTQTCASTVSGTSRLLKLRELYALRAPGNTCLNALEASKDGAIGTLESPINNSKGCGGVMRVAPIGLIADGVLVQDSDVRDMLGAKAAALTHGHPLGYIPSAALVHIVHLAAFTDMPLYEAANDTLEAMKRIFEPSDSLEFFVSLCDEAIGLAKSRMTDRASIQRLGAGWVAEEAFAIALFCALRYHGDIDRVLITAVNHGGDSDSTGAIAGNIIGARLGEPAIPTKFTENLELSGTLRRLADDIYTTNLM